MVWRFRDIRPVAVGIILVCPTLVWAQGLIAIDDLNIIYQPEPAHYQPSGDDLDLADEGKSFEVTCVVSSSGRLMDCEAEDNDMADQKFVEVAVESVGKWVVGTETLSGENAVGRLVTITCRFRLEGGEERTSIAAR
ncbi:hypothetical protein ABAC460_04350 [Asticcacaulis sp. AC460]|uniref:hypothetical protein n=1 Tax=Asticcacaulis sp. AC460 TaxID=1282360 RepID=UPI0003C3CF5A|nr:hypothetical protein [Asticcacaulis sp. AC460]ESQ92123.1 hypothetical protein ABAC460_04350 [Asticcacaulis sp. AC460]